MASAPERVVVLRFGALGDVVLTSAALAALEQAWPQTEIIFVTKSKWAAAVLHNPRIKRLLLLEDGESLATLQRRLQALNPDCVLDLHDNLRSRRLRNIVSRDKIAVWHKRPFWHGLAVRLRLTPYAATMHIAARYHMATEQLVASYADTKPVTLPRRGLELWISSPDLQSAREKLQGAGLKLDRPIVGMAPGAMWATKRWPTERLAELANAALDHGVQVVLTGSPDEQNVTAEIAKAAPGCADLAGQVGLGELAGLIDSCTAFVANDSGPMHMARALGVPTLAFFGCTDPAQFDFSGHGLMYANVDCAPCSLYGLASCPRRHFRCMLDIETHAAWLALRNLLRAGRCPPVIG